jgi:predicted nicotinamide N-methyase
MPDARDDYWCVRYCKSVAEQAAWFWGRTHSVKLSEILGLLGYGKKRAEVEEPLVPAPRCDGLFQKQIHIGKHVIPILAMPVAPGEGHLDDDETGLTLWPSSILIASLLLKHRNLHCTDVLELGCGAGLCGIAAAMLCHARSVVLSDREPKCLSLAAKNASLNLNMVGACPTRVEAWGWAEGDARPAEHGGFGLVIASDVLYSEQHSRLNAEMLHRFVDLLDWCLAPGGTLLLGFFERNEGGEADVLATLRQSNFDVQQVILATECHLSSEALARLPKSGGCKVLRCTRSTEAEVRIH